MIYFLMVILYRYYRLFPSLCEKSKQTETFTHEHKEVKESFNWGGRKREKSLNVWLSMLYLQWNLLKSILNLYWHLFSNYGLTFQ